MTVVARRALIFAALFAWCGFLLAGRVYRSGTLAYTFLVWNLFLAMLPAVFGVLFARATQRGSFAIVRAIWFVLWLLFLPNAPYIVTDFIHLTAMPRVPLWFDIALLLSFAGTGLLLGYSSVADVQGAIALRFGRAVGWCVAFLAVLLSGFGIYLGRFLRWNSWDAFTDPFDMATYIARHSLHPLAHERSVAVTLVYGVGLALGYVAYQLPRLRMNMQSP
ncbi:MAG TPA: DUF1361 domain-containing protein [Thermoanaerobaculia bacterium]|nr:DUF1361 domain-containing protein [Thermoanaerobaculia bacterium]